MRVHYFRYALNEQGQPIADATVNVYEAGTITPANIYEAESGGSAVSFVMTDEDGSFEFWVDSADYDAFTQEFKIVVSKSGLASKTFDYINIFPLMTHDHGGGGGGAVDHGSLTGLNDDDHTLYIRTDGLRAFVGVVSGIYPTASSHLATKKYVDDQLAAFVASVFTSYSLAANGYAKFKENGLIFQWGEQNVPHGYLDVTLPIPFPTSCLQVLASADGLATGGDNRFGAQITSASVIRLLNYTDTGHTYKMRWFAIGY